MHPLHPLATPMLNKLYYTQTLKPTVVVCVSGVRTVSEVEAESRGGGTRSNVRRRTATLAAAVVAVDEVKRVDERTSRCLGGSSTAHPHNNAYKFSWMLSLARL